MFFALSPVTKSTMQSFTISQSVNVYLCCCCYCCFDQQCATRRRHGCSYRPDRYMYRLASVVNSHRERGSALWLDKLLNPLDMLLDATLWVSEVWVMQVVFSCYHGTTVGALNRYCTVHLWLHCPLLQYTFGLLKLDNDILAVVFFCVALQPVMRRHTRVRERTGSWVGRTDLMKQINNMTWFPIGGNWTAFHSCSETIFIPGKINIDIELIL